MTNWKPEEKVVYGGLSAATTVGVVAIAQYFGQEFDAALVGTIVAGIYAAVAYWVPNKYRAHLEDADRIAQILAARHPGLDREVVANELAKPGKRIELIESSDAIAQLAKASTKRILY